MSEQHENISSTEDQGVIDTSLTILEVEFQASFDLLALRQFAISQGCGFHGIPSDPLIRSERMLADVFACLARIEPPGDWPLKSVSAEWAAGFADGEGHFGINKHIRRVNGRPQYTPRIEIGNTDRSLLTPFEIFGGEIKEVDAGRWNPNAAKSFKWSVHCREARDFILAVLPYMKHRRRIAAAKALLSLEFLRKRPGGNKPDERRVIQQEHYYQRVRLLNTRGQLTPEEAMEIERLCNHDIPQFTATEAELADVVLRIMDFSVHRGLRVAQAVVAKLKYNATRPRMHGGKKF